MARKNDLTFKITATDADGNVVECTSTPAMWALADEWVDSLMASGAHTEEWRTRKLINGFEYLALQRELAGKTDENGEPVFPDMRIDGKPTLPAVAWMIDAYDVDWEPIGGTDVDEDSNANPTQAGAGDGPEPA